MNKHAKRGAALGAAVVAGVSFLAQPALADSSLITGAGTVAFHNPYGAGDGTAGNTDWMSENFLPNPIVLGAAQRVGAMANLGPWAIGDNQGAGAAAWTLSVQLVDDAGDGLPFYNPYNDNGTPANFADDTGQADVYLPVPVVDEAGFSTGDAVVPAAFTAPTLVNNGANVTIAQTAAPGSAGQGYFMVSFRRPMVARVLPTAQQSTTYRGDWQVTLV